MASRFSFEVVDASDYDALRPGYAPEAVAWVAERGALERDSLLVDLAAGTGQLSKRFAALGVRIVAIEPARNMRSVIEQGLRAVGVMDGSAEAMPLADGVAECVVVGNAFHHFDEERAFEETRRVLRPGGALAVFWAWPGGQDDAGYPGSQEVEEAMRGMPEAIPSVTAYRRWVTGPPLAKGFSKFERREFATVHAVPSSRLADLYATSSDVASLPTSARVRLLDRIRDISRSLPEVLESSGLSVVDLCFRE